MFQEHDGNDSFGVPIKETTRIAASRFCNNIVNLFHDSTLCVEDNAILLNEELTVAYNLDSLNSSVGVLKTCAMVRSYIDAAVPPVFTTLVVRTDKALPSVIFGSIVILQNFYTSA